MRKKLLYSFVLSVACMSATAQDAPVADLLDVSFNIDGTAEDISPMHNMVEFVGDGPTIAYNAAFDRNVATFNTSWSAKPAGYYKINFENNQEFRDAIADGHSLEILVMPNYEGALQNVEAKPFSAMQAGGTGFLICTTGNGGGKNSFTFLPNVSTTGNSTWRWATSGVTPMVGFYYHVIGVWNKEEAKAYIYVTPWTLLENSASLTRDATGSVLVEMQVAAVQRQVGQVISSSHEYMTNLSQARKQVFFGISSRSRKTLPTLVSMYKLLKKVDSISMASLLLKV